MMSEAHLSDATENGRGAEGYSHYNPVNVEVILGDTVAVVVLALLALTLLVILLRMQTRQERLLRRLAQGVQSRAGT